MIYLFFCEHCNLSFEVKRKMADASCLEQCPKCGFNAGRRYTAIPFSVGWRLTEASHERGNPNELEKDI